MGKKQQLNVNIKRTNLVCQLLPLSACIAQCMMCSLYVIAPMLNMLIARMLLNVQYAHCMCAARRLTCSVYVHHKNKQKKATRCPIVASECMYDAECSICLLDVCMLECPLMACAVCLVCVCVCVQKKKGSEFGEIGRSELLDQNYAQDLIVKIQY